MGETDQKSALKGMAVSHRKVAELAESDEESAASVQLNSELTEMCKFMAKNYHGVGGSTSGERGRTRRAKTGGEMKREREEKREEDRRREREEERQRQRKRGETRRGQV